MHFLIQYSNGQFVNIQAKALKTASHCADKMSQSTKTLVTIVCMEQFLEHVILVLSVFTAHQQHHIHFKQMENWK